jgi:hypothetical protein
MTAVPLLAAVLTCAGACHAAGSWGFETPDEAWTTPGGESGVVALPEGGHAFQIAATQPHHTRLMLRGSADTPDFVATLRIKFLDWTGEPPAVYVYGRSGPEGFRGLVVRGAAAGGMAYYGQGKPGANFGEASADGQDGNGWLWVKLACYGDLLQGSIWAQGQPEPGWQIRGEASGQASGEFGVGVWTSPRTPSTARVLVDDISFRPILAEDVVALGIRTRNRAPLRLEGLPDVGSFECGTDVGLATPASVVTFDRATGELTHIVDRDSGQDFVAPQQYRALFSVALVQPEGRRRLTVDSGQFQRVAVSRDGERALRLSFSGLPGEPLRAEVGARIGEDGLIHLRLAVRDPGRWAASAAQFPLFACPAKLSEDPGDDHIILPGFGLSDGAELPAPGTTNMVRGGDYPGAVCVQFTAYYGARSGLYWATYDPAGNAKRWELRTLAGRSVEMPITHLQPEVVGADLAPDYDTVLGTFRGDWRDAADIYKRWAVGQPWCRRRLSEREDIAVFLKEGTGGVVQGIPNERERPGVALEAIERAPQMMAEYRNRTGLAHMLYIPYGWENRGTWVGINYLPANPSDDAWRTLNEQLRAQGDRTAFLTSGFWWVVKRQKTGSGPAFDDTADFEQRQGMVVHNPDGTPWKQDSYNLTASHGDWRGLSVKLCHGSQTARSTMRDIFLNVARLGTPLVSFDQEIGGGQNVPCYSGSHGHPPGWGQWMWTGFRDLCAEILAQGKPIQPELGMFMENTSEVAIPYMATYWSRQFGVIDHGAPGARGMGLFSYLYHEYVTAIGAACVQGQGDGRPSAEMRCAALANNLTRGLIPVPFLQDVPLEPMDEWHRKVSTAFFSFCQPYARFPEYLTLGQTVRPLAVTCQPTQVGYFVTDPTVEPTRPGGPRLREVKLELPAVQAGSYRAVDGSLGTVIVNITGGPQEARVRLPQGAWREFTLFFAQREVQETWTQPPADGTVAVQLEPYGTRMLVAR